MADRALTATEVADGLAQFIARAPSEAERTALEVALDARLWEARAVEEWSPDLPPPAASDPNEITDEVVSRARRWAEQCRAAVDACTPDTPDSSIKRLTRRAENAERTLTQLEAQCPP